LPKFSLFHKKKQPEEQKPAEPVIEEPKQEAAAPPQEEPKQEPAATPQESIVSPPEQVLSQPVPSEPAVAAPEPVKETAVAPVEQKPAEPQSKTYLKAMPLKDISDLENIKNEVKNGNIIILRVTPLASKSIEDVKSAVNELYEFAESIGGDIARLGEERVVLCPKTIRIWREKSPAPVVSNEPLPTAA
jgi:uncharacterized protein